MENKCKVPGCKSSKSWYDAFGKFHTADCSHIGLEIALKDARFSHVTTRTWCGQDSLYVYFKDHTSPTNVILAYSCEDSDTTRAVLNEIGTRAHVGPTRGAIAIGAEKGKHGKRHAKKANTEDRVTYLDLSGPNKPESEFPDVVSKGKL
jgi:hypothetical protein